MTMYKGTDGKLYLNGELVAGFVCWDCNAGVEDEWKSFPPRTEITDIGSKCLAGMLLADRYSGIVIPSREEWIGLNLLERDDELPNRRR